MASASVLAPGRARGLALVLEEPLSLWGGTDPEDGTITDRRHPQHGLTFAGTVLVMPAGRGSSSSSSVLAEAIRYGTAPVAIVLAEPDPILALGAVVATELYETTCPVVVAPPPVYDRIGTGDEVEVIATEGALSVTSRPRA